MLSKLIIGMLVSATIVIPVAAFDGSQGQNDNGQGQNGDQDDHRIVHAVPGPVAGVGLPVLVVAGGYAFWRRKRRQAAKKDTSHTA